MIQTVYMSLPVLLLVLPLGIALAVATIVPVMRNGNPRHKSEHKQAVHQQLSTHAVNRTQPFSATVLATLVIILHGAAIATVATAAASLPASPQSVMPLSEDGRATVSWTWPPEVDGSQLAVWIEGSCGVHSTIAMLVATPPAFLVPNLANGIDCDITLASQRVHDAPGDGIARSDATQLQFTVGAPQQATNLRAVSAGVTSATVHWTPGTAPVGNVTAQTVSMVPVDSGSAATPPAQTVAATTAFLEVTGLTPGAEYRVAVVGHSAIGDATPGTTLYTAGSGTCCTLNTASNNPSLPPQPSISRLPAVSPTR